MRNVNLNILKLLEFIDNFCLSLSNIGLEVRRQETPRQETGDYFYLFSPLPHFPTSHFPLRRSS
ncbi:MULTISPECIES: hypothetical protein [Microcystis]|uniref:hypothetical protein n=1 Tax=Microcystis sp. M179S2 TaxID=2771160 RepID=UPI001F558BA1|nr:MULTISPECIES: hypothetical protein [Microcystis]